MIFTMVIGEKPLLLTILIPASQVQENSVAKKRQTIIFQEEFQVQKSLLEVHFIAEGSQIQMD
jgi:hypothetical protein